MKIKQLSLAACLVLASGLAANANTVYNVNASFSGAGVVGTVTTDGTFGVLATGNILDYSLLANIGASQLSLFGPLSGNNSQWGIFGSSLTATATALSFDFSSDPSNWVIVQTPFIGAGSNFICLNACAASVAIGIGDPRFFADVTGVQEVATAAAVPSPVVGAGLPDLISTVGALFYWKRRRKTVSSL